MSVSMADIGSEMMGVSISEWAELAKKVTNIIECRIKVQIIIKELGVPYEDFSDEWIAETSKKLLVPPELIANEIKIHKHNLEHQGVENL